MRSILGWRGDVRRGAGVSGRRDGIRRDDPATWMVEQPTGFQSRTRSGAFAEMASPALRGALDEMLGAWKAPRRWGTPIVRFPSGGPAWRSGRRGPRDTWMPPAEVADRLAALGVVDLSGINRARVAVSSTYAERHEPLARAPCDRSSISRVTSGFPSMVALRGCLRHSGPRPGPATGYRRRRRSVASCVVLEGFR